MAEIFTLDDVLTTLAQAPEATAVPVKFLGDLSVENIPEGTRILVENNEPAEDPFIEWNGELYRKGDAFFAYVPYNVRYHHWDHVISHKVYFDLLKHAVERRAQNRGDVEMVSHNVESRSLYFSYTCKLDADNLQAAYRSARKIQQSLEHLADEVNNRVKDIIASLLQLVESIVDAET